MRLRISIRGRVRPSVGPSVRPLVRRSVRPSRVIFKRRVWPFLKVKSHEMTSQTMIRWVTTRRSSRIYCTPAVLAIQKWLWSLCHPSTAKRHGFHGQNHFCQVNFFIVHFARIKNFPFYLFVTLERNKKESNVNKENNFLCVKKNIKKFDLKKKKFCSWNSCVVAVLWWH